MDIFVINLQKEFARRIHMENLCAKNNIAFNMMNAVDGFFLSIDIVKNITDREKSIKELGRELTKGEIACALSHKHIYEIIKKRKIDYALILEDDVVFSDSILDILNSVQMFPDDWECILLSYYRNAYFKKQYALSFRGRIKINNKFKTVRFIEAMHSAAAYIINFSGAVKILNLLNHCISQPIDHYIGNEKYINLYGIHPRPVYIDHTFGSISSISPERNKNIDDCKLVEFRNFLRKYNLFKLAKKINIYRQKIYFFIERYIYVIMHIYDCLKRPERYRK